MMNSKKNISIYIFLMLSIFAFGQTENRISEDIKRARQTNIEFADLMNLFNFQSIEEKKKNIKQLKDYQVIELNESVLKKLQASTYFITSIPFKDTILTLEMQKVDDSFISYRINTSSGNIHESNQKGQSHYRGIIQNQAGESIVALSFYNSEVCGLVSSKNLGTINIAKYGKELSHIIYSDKDITNISSCNILYDCYTNSYVQNPLLDEIYSSLNPKSTIKSKSGMKVDGNHLSVYIEVDNGIFQELGSNAANVENFITGLFNQVSTLYTNENIFVQISEIFIWDTADDYSSNISDGLADFVTARTNFNGDLALLLSYSDGDDDPNNTANAGGIANGIGGLCVVGNNDLSPHAHISLFPDFVEFPLFSRQVKVVAHEMGHVLGSRHTHACVWNGNNTAIDGCGSCLESANEPITCNACVRPVLPAEGGTIMSYCDRETIGVNFALGFGFQPSTVIRNFILNAECLDCDAIISDRIITTDVVINACNVSIENVSIENNATFEVNATGNVIINGAFEAEIGTILDISNE